MPPLLSDLLSCNDYLLFLIIAHLGVGGRIGSTLGIGSGFPVNPYAGGG